MCENVGHWGGGGFDPIPLINVKSNIHLTLLFLSTEKQEHKQHC
jgi:hypothetical protein